jgi:PTS system nitrogen regulatory IIA component
MNLSVRDAANLLSVSEKTIYRWIKLETIPAYRVADQYRFNRAEILEWATSRRMNVSSEIFAEPEAASQPIPALLTALEAGGVFYRVSGFDRESALREVVEILRLPDEVDRPFLLRVLLVRVSRSRTCAIRWSYTLGGRRSRSVSWNNRSNLALLMASRCTPYSRSSVRPHEPTFT